jgi:F0F1-type ATP synthase membrane subunit b/b'
MARPETDNQPRNDEFSRIFSEYRARIDEITRRTEKKFKSINDREDLTPAVVVEEPVAARDESPPPPPVEALPEEPEEEEEIAPVLTPAPGRHYRGPEIANFAPPPEPESAAIIREVRQKARKIVEEAEQRVKKEAKKKTQAQVDRLLETARKEAGDIIAAARESAEKEKNEIIAVSRREAEQAVADITGKCRHESQTKSSQAIAEAREKAQKMMADVIESGTEVNRLIGEIIDRANATLTEFETRLRAETGDLARIITETRTRLDEVTAAARQEAARPAPPVIAAPKGDISGSPTLAVRLLGDRSNGRDGTPTLFRGQVEMRSSSANDYQYLKNLKKYLVSLPDVKYLQEYASEKEMSVLFDIREPLPLLDVLRQVPLVEDIVEITADELSIVFKAAA